MKLSDITIGDNEVVIRIDDALDGDKVKEVGSAEMNAKLTNQLNRLAELGNEINASEGIVFKYGDRLMKSTGSFAAVNQILGMRFQM